MLSRVQARSTEWPPDAVEPETVPGDAAADGLAFMFTDMEGYTSLIERLGDERARKVVDNHDRIVRSQLAPFGGREVEQHGDAFLLVFDCALRALLSAVSMQHAFSLYGRAHPQNPIRVRIGVHKGSALRAGQGFFGRTVVAAARIAAQAQGGEILASQTVQRAVGAPREIVFGEPRAVHLKGLDGIHLLHPVTPAGAPSLRP